MYKCWTYSTTCVTPPTWILKHCAVQSTFYAVLYKVLKLFDIGAMTPHTYVSYMYLELILRLLNLLLQRQIHFDTGAFFAALKNLKSSTSQMSCKRGFAVRIVWYIPYTIAGPSRARWYLFYPCVDVCSTRVLIFVLPVVSCARCYLLNKCLLE
jgi:hypothetical protein